MTDKSIVIVDARGHRCPTPTLRLRKALLSGGVGDLVRLIADDPMAKIDVPLFVRGSGHQLLGQEDVDGVLLFTVRITDSPVGK